MERRKKKNEDGLSKQGFNKHCRFLEDIQAGNSLLTKLIAFKET